MFCWFSSMFSQKQQGKYILFMIAHILQMLLACIHWGIKKIYEVIKKICGVFWYEPSLDWWERMGNDGTTLCKAWKTMGVHPASMENDGRTLCKHEKPSLDHGTSLKLLTYAQSMSVMFLVSSFMSQWVFGKHRVPVKWIGVVYECFQSCNSNSS